MITVYSITLLVFGFLSPHPGQSVFIHNMWEDYSKQRWQWFISLICQTQQPDQRCALDGGKYELFTEQEIRPIHCFPGMISSHVHLMTTLKRHSQSRLSGSKKGSLRLKLDVHMVLVGNILSAKNMLNHMWSGNGSIFTSRIGSLHSCRSYCYVAKQAKNL